MCADAATWRELDQRSRAGAPVFAMKSEDDGEVYAFVRAQDAFDLSRRDLLASAYDDIVDAAIDADMVLFVDGPAVVGGEFTGGDGAAYAQAVSCGVNACKTQGGANVSRDSAGSVGEARSDLRGGFRHPPAHSERDTKFFASVEQGLVEVASANEDGTNGIRQWGLRSSIQHPLQHLRYQ